MDPVLFEKWYGVDTKWNLVLLEVFAAVEFLDSFLA